MNIRLILEAGIKRRGLFELTPKERGELTDLVSSLPENATLRDLVELAKSMDVSNGAVRFVLELLKYEREQGVMGALPKKETPKPKIGLMSRIVSKIRKSL